MSRERKIAGACGYESSPRFSEKMKPDSILSLPHVSTHTCAYTTHTHHTETH